MHLCSEFQEIVFIYKVLLFLSPSGLMLFSSIFASDIDEGETWNKVLSALQGWALEMESLLSSVDDDKVKLDPCLLRVPTVQLLQ